MTAMGNRQWAIGDAAPGTTRAVSPGTRPPLRRVPRREKALQLPLIGEDELPLGAEIDRLPEQTQYRDEGCELWHACLSCPFSRCALEIRGGPNRVLRLFRNAEARRLFDEGAPIEEIAAELGMARRTVYNALDGVRRRARGNRESGVGSQEPLSKRRVRTSRRERPRLPTPDSRFPRE